MEACRKRLIAEKAHYSELVLSPLCETPPFLQWTLALQGLPMPYEKQTHLLEVSYPLAYPFAAPYMRFQTRLYHPNVNTSGQLSALVLDTWTPYHNIFTIHERIQELLTEPLMEYPYNEEATTLWGTPDFQQKALAFYGTHIGKNVLDS
jgi:ubiquitin-protein ligase